MSLFEPNIEVSDEYAECSDNPEEERYIIEGEKIEESLIDDNWKSDESKMKEDSIIDDNKVTKAEDTKDINDSKPKTSHTMSVSTIDCSSNISKTTSSKEPPKLGFSIAQIMGYMNRGVNFKNIEESRSETVKKEASGNELKRENFAERDTNKFKNLSEERKSTFRKFCSDSESLEADSESQQDFNKVDKSKHSKHDTSLWRPQPCRKYINAAAFQAAAAASALSSDSSFGPSLVNASSSSPSDCALLSPSAEPPSGSISSIPFSNANIPLPPQDISTLALLRQYSLMNFSNPWKTASLLSSYSNLLGLHSQIGHQQQKGFPGECNGLAPSISGLPYTTNNNNTTHPGSSMGSNFDVRSLPPPLNFMGGMSSTNSIGQFDHGNSPEGIPNALNRAASMNIPSCIDNNVRANPSLLYPTHGYPTLKLSENNVKNNLTRGKLNLSDELKASSVGDGKTQAKSKNSPNSDSTNTTNKSSTSQQKTFPCTECGKVFNAHYNLTRHMPVHTGKKYNNYMSIDKTIISRRK